MGQTARTFHFQANVESEECYKCGVVFWVSAVMCRRWRNTGETFYCPNGHGQVYEEGTLQKQLAAMESDRDWWKGATRAEEKRHIATRGQIAKLKNRIGAGVCPCCRRTFKQLAAHMTRQHPKYGE